MNSQLPTPNSQTTKGTKRSKGTTDRSVFVNFVASIAAFVIFVVPALGQQQLDRVVARVGTAAITQTDVEAALAFGVVEAKDAEGRDALKQLIDRRLILMEVNKFPPAEPDPTAIKTLMESMRAAAGANVAAVMKRTGVNDDRLAEIARDTLRIRSYLQSRFGSGGARADQQRAKWLSDLRARGAVTELSARP